MSPDATTFDDDYAAFERVLKETLAIQPTRVCSYRVMPKA